MAVTSTDIILRWPALAQIAGTAEFDAALADAALQVKVSSWAEFTDLGTIHHAAHHLMVAHPEISGPGMTGPGPISSERAGEVARTYAVEPVSRAGGFRSTAPGREYLRLARLLGVSAMVV